LPALVVPRVEEIEMMNRSMRFGLLLVAGVSVSACTDLSPGQQALATGGLGGGAIGGLLGSFSGNAGLGALLGAGVGAGGGYLFSQSQQARRGYNPNYANSGYGSGGYGGGAYNERGGYGRDDYRGGYGRRRDQGRY
jgi:hypothetical protein